MNSGIRPNLCRSSGQHLAEQVEVVALGVQRGAEADALLADAADEMMSSSPANAPATMNSTFVVSIWMNSWCGCLRPPCGGTEATVPSRIFSSACCTPSPETSRVIDGFSALRAILSTSSM